MNKWEGRKQDDTINFIDSQDPTLHHAFHRFATRILPKPRRRSPSPRYHRSAPRRYSADVGGIMYYEWVVSPGMLYIFCRTLV